MSITKAILLGAAAALVAIPAARAADLPVRGAAPVDYVRVCSNQGPGYFVVPGTETCLQLSGYVRADYLFAEYVEGDERDQDAIGFLARGQVNFDARTGTEYGTLRSFVRVQGDAFGGETEVSLDQGFIQFAGLTAGRVTSFFDFWGGELIIGLQTDTTTEVLAYTATFGSGLSATISLENAASREADGLTGAFRNGGQALPDLVGAVRVDQSWGSAQVMGALTQVRPDDPSYRSELGWALGAGITAKLPTLSAGDALWLQAVVSEGAVGYANLGGTAELRDFTVGGVGDAVVDPLAGTTATSRAWMFSAGLQHYWTPSLSQVLQGSFAKVDASPVDGADLSYSIWQLGTRLNWRPVMGLVLSGEVSYIGAERDEGAAPAAETSSRWLGALRIQRDF